MSNVSMHGAVSSDGDRMTPQQLMVLVAAVLTTLNEMESLPYAGLGHPFPRSPFYLALGCDISKTLMLEHTLTHAGLCLVTTNTIALTSSGRAKATELEVILKKKGGAK